MDLGKITSPLAPAGKPGTGAALPPAKTAPPARTTDSLSLGATASVRPAEVSQTSDPRFAAGYHLIQQRFSADTVDPPKVFQDQLRAQASGQLGADAYHFVVLGAPGKKDAKGAPTTQTTGVATSNYFHSANIVFENYFVAKGDPNASKALLEAMTQAGQQDAARNGGSLAAVVVEADAKEVPAKRALGYVGLTGVKYMQPPLTPGGAPVALPLMLKVTNPDDPGFITDHGQVIGMTRAKATEIISDIYHNVYDKQAGKGPLPSAVYLPKILASMGQQDILPLQ